MTEKEKMLAGELYNSTEKTLSDERVRAKTLCEMLNRTSVSEGDKRQEIVKELLGKSGKNAYIESNVWFDYGYNTEVGENFYVNHDCVFLDCAKITFGDNVFIAPQCGFYTAGHPLEAETRNAFLEFAKPISVGSDVWIGGGVKIMPGVTVGDNVVIGGGSVVVKDIPSDSVAVGNPARVIKKLPRDKKRTEKTDF